MNQRQEIKKFIECLLTQKNTSAKTHLQNVVNEKIKQQIINNNNKGLF